MFRKEKKYLQVDGESITVFSPQEIRQQLESILASPDFDATKQQRALLEFVISQTLAGNSHGIKGYTVATQVFGRDESFDQAIDPIVSIQANKLRRSLERYYLLSGKEDVMYIDIPRGSYVPVFREQNNAPAKTVPRHQTDGLFVSKGRGRPCLSNHFKT